jgi:hypothetical protein
MHVSRVGNYTFSPSATPLLESCTCLQYRLLGNMNGWGQGNLTSVRAKMLSSRAAGAVLLGSGVHFIGCHLHLKMGGGDWERDVSGN